MRFHNLTFVGVLVIVYIVYPSQSISIESCRAFLLSYNQIQSQKEQIVKDMQKEKHLPVEKPHPTTSLKPEIRLIGNSGSLFIEALTRCSESLTDADIPNSTLLTTTCPFSADISCEEGTIYRNFDGSCNNLKHPYWGKANTPYRRLLPADYQDGISKPRCESVLGGPLPEPRYISVNFHRPKSPEILDNVLTHLTMTFGQFVNHELASTVTQSSDPIDCCARDQNEVCVKPKCQVCEESIFYEKCLPIHIPRNDPYFSFYGRTCLPFFRAMPTPNLSCQLGPKEQLNAQTSYIDCSQVYGSSLEEANRLRTMNGGLLKVFTPTNHWDLLPIDNKTFCKKPDNYCFVAGDSRVNQNLLLQTMHTLYLREHNRLARLLAEADPSLNDEGLFQKARQILIAQTQHIFYAEYLPRIIGEAHMKEFGLMPLKSDGYTRYEPDTDARLSNAHAGAAFRFGHSTIRTNFANGRGEQVLLSPSFGHTDPFYKPGDAPTGYSLGLIDDLSQGSDRFLSKEITDKLFENTPGQGSDLASINIQRGRDIGLKPYTEWRRKCGLSIPHDFNGLVDHTKEDRNQLMKIYKSVHDIDLWTAGLSEIHLDGARVGPTFACILAEQFRVIKYGDRFWYEHSGPNQFSPSELSTIREAKLSRLICDNSQIKNILIDPFLSVEESRNGVVNCDTFPQLDICSFVRKWGEWSDWSECVQGFRNRTRNCFSPVQGPCVCEEHQTETEKDIC